MRTVFNNRMVAHVWAQQTQPEGRGCHLYFHDTTIYSYGSHFPIARFVTHKRKTCVLFTTRSYSISTAKHIGYAHGALRGLSTPVFNVLNPVAIDHKFNMQDYRDRVRTAMEQAATARTYMQMHMDRAFSLTNEGNDYAAFFGLKQRIKQPVFSDEFIAGIKNKQRKHAAAEKAKADRRKVEVAKLIEAWRQHEEPVNSILPWNHGDTLLRVSGDEVETSRGARVPLRHAKRLWPYVLKVTHGETVTPMANFKMGLFTLNRIESNGDAVIGCHTITFGEMQRLATQLGL